MKIAVTIAFAVIALVLIVFGILEAIKAEGEQEEFPPHKNVRDTPLFPIVYVAFILLGLGVAGVWES